jgi:crotonobetainyl-CoA:carnitine CoA-transferase CaiB-like acyl-CoA transferase
MQSLSGGEIKPFRAGRHSFYLAPVGIFKGREKYIVIMCALDHQWQTLCEVMDQPELAKDRRFATREERIRNLPVLVEVIEGWIRSMPSDEAAMSAMRAPCADGAGIDSRRGREASASAPAGNRAQGPRSSVG